MFKSTISVLWCYFETWLKCFSDAIYFQKSLELKDNISTTVDQKGSLEIGLKFKRTIW